MNTVRRSNLDVHTAGAVSSTVISMGRMKVNREDENFRLTIKLIFLQQF